MATIRIREPEALVGRDADCAMRLSDPHISRRHAVLRREGGRYAIEVLPHVTHASVVTRNGVVLAPRQRYELMPGDVLVFGGSPAYLVAYQGRTLALECPDETVGAPMLPDAMPLLAFHPISQIPKVLRESFHVVGDITKPAPGSVMDVAAVSASAAASVAEKLRDLRAGRFFLPVAVLGDQAPRPDQVPFPVMGDAYLWVSARDPQLSERMLSFVSVCRERERAALPYRTAEILYMDRAAGRILGHDWVRRCPRELSFSELRHQILLLLAQSHRERQVPLGLSEVESKLEESGWARSRRTVGNELSVKLPAALRRAGLHPALFAAIGTRERVYGVSTPPTCIRDLRGDRQA